MYSYLVVLNENINLSFVPSLVRHSKWSEVQVMDTIYNYRPKKQAGTVHYILQNVKAIQHKNAVNSEICYM